MLKYSKRMGGLAIVLLLTGCSAKDPVTTTPSYHIGTPTNRSTVNSWELNREPFYTQPGVNGGKPITIQSIPSQRRFEPDDPLAVDVYSALTNDGTVPVRFIASRAKDGIVQLIGTVQTAEQKKHAEAIARAVPGVKVLRSELTVVPPQK